MEKQGIIMVATMVFGAFGLAAWLMQWELVLILCETLCLAGYVLGLTSGRVPVRGGLAMLAACVMAGAVCLSPVGAECLVRQLDYNPRFFYYVQGAEDSMPWLLRRFMAHPDETYAFLAYSLAGLCVAGMIVLWIEHLVRKWPNTTTVFFAALVIHSIVIVLLDIDRNSHFINFFISSAYCIVLMLGDILSASNRKNKAFWVILLISMLFSPLVIMVATRLYVDYWTAIYSFSLCSAVLYIMWIMYNKRLAR